MSVEHCSIWHILLLFNVEGFFFYHLTKTINNLTILEKKHTIKL